MEYYIGVDLGGTNIVAGLVNEDAVILRKESIRTNLPRSPEAVCDDIAMLCRKLLEGSGIGMDELGWIGVGSPGIVRDGTVIYANNLDFRNVRLSEMLEERTGKKTFLQNDGNAAAYGELIAGAGVGYRSIVAVMLGTGVGGGIVLDGRIHSGFNGAAGELGHTVIVAGGRACTCGRQGCLEAYCSATAIKRITAEAMEADRSSLLWELCGQDITRVSARTPFQAARQGDASGQRVVDDFVFHLGTGIRNVVSLLQPEVVCIGGGVSKEGDAIILPLRRFLEEQSCITEDNLRTRIVTSILGSDAPLIGASLKLDTSRAPVSRLAKC